MVSGLQLIVRGSCPTQRSAQGYNLVETSLFSANFNNNAYVNATGQDWDGTWPFTTTSNPSSGLNSTFWARRDYMFSSAAAHGFTVCVSITGPNLEGASTNICRAWTNTQWSDLGTALGTRYASTPNIVWIVILIAILALAALYYLKVIG